MGEVDLSRADIHVVGVSERIAEVKDLEVLPDGSVWVLNSLAPFFLGFEPDGSPLAAYGTEGGGPEEFGQPSAFVTRSIHGEAWVLDTRRHALVRVSGPEAPRIELSLRGDLLPPGSILTGLDMMDYVVRTARLGGEVLLARTTRPEGSDFFHFRLAMLAADILAVDTATGSVRKVVALGDVLGDLSGAIDLSEGGLPLWYRLWAVCGEDRFRVHDRLRNELLTFDSQGVELEPIPLPPIAFSEVTPRQFARAIFPLRRAEMMGNVWEKMSPADSIRLLNQTLENLHGSPEQLAQYLPRYVDFRCSDSGTMWLRPYDVDTGDLAGGPTWLRITPSGARDRVRFPPRFDPYRFTEERVWGVQRDEYDVASLAWIGLASAP